MSNVRVRQIAKNLLVLGFSVIPLKPSAKEPAVAWSSFQTKPMDIEDVDRLFMPKSNLGIVTGWIVGNRQFVVVDFDDKDTFFRLKDKLPDTVFVETKRGYHAYFFVLSAIPIKTEKFGQVDIKAKGGYVVAPPSVVNGHSYYYVKFLPGEVIYDDELEITRIAVLELSEWDSLLREIKASLGVVTTSGAPTLATTLAVAGAPAPKPVDEIQKQKEREMEYLLNLLQKYYIPGTRQNICIGLAGFLRKEGYELEEVLELFQKLWSIIPDPEISQRIAGIKMTYTKPIQAIAGLSLLPDDFVKEIQKEDSPMNFKWGWYRRGNKLVEYVQMSISKKKKVKIPKVIGPWLNWVRKMYKNKKYEFQFYFDGDWFEISNIGEIQSIVEHTGINVIHRQKYLRYLNTLSEIAPKYYCLDFIGFNKEGEFFHPVMSNPYYIWSEDLSLMAKTADPQRHLAIIQKYLEREDVFKIGYSFVLGSVLTQKPIMLLLHGPTGVGKTTLGILLANMFLPPDKHISGFTTQVGLELLQKKFKVPFLVDEIQLSQDFERIAFRVASGKSKTRGSKKMEVRVDDILSSLIFTSELPEHELGIQRLGVHRRIIPLEILSPLNIDYEDVYVWGGGVPIIQWWIENGRPGLNLNIDNRYKIIYNIAYTLLLGAYVLEKYFQNVSVTPSVENFLKKFIGEVSQKLDVVDEFYQAFTAWILASYQNFLKGGNENISKTKNIFGIIEEHDEKIIIYVTTHIFREYFGKYHLRYLFKELEESEKIKIIKSKDAIRHTKRIGGIVSSCYCFELLAPDLANELQDLSNLANELQDS